MYPFGAGRGEIPLRQAGRAPAARSGFASKGRAISARAAGLAGSCRRPGRASGPEGQMAAAAGPGSAPEGHPPRREGPLARRGSLRLMTH